MLETTLDENQLILQVQISNHFNTTLFKELGVNTQPGVIGCNYL